MKWKINMVLIVLGIFITNNILSQSHTLDISTGCRLAKPVKGSARNYGKNCPACVKENEAETKAKKEEDARFYQQAKEKEAKLKREREQAIAEQNKKIAEETEAQKKNELVVTQNKTNTASNNQSEESTNKDYEKEFMYTIKGEYGGGNYITYLFSHNYNDYNGFIYNGDTLFKDKYQRTFGRGLKDENNFPRNIGIAVLKEKYIRTYNPITRKYYTQELQICDLINSKGDRYFKDSTISAIIHLSENYFLIARGNPFISDHYTKFDSAELYNVFTKESIPLKQNEGGGAYNGGVIIGKSCCNLIAGWEKDWSEKGTYKVILIDTEIGLRKYATYVLNNNNEVEIKYH
jgi:hypothetical protein